MSDADAFLDAIFAHPADDTPRLVYADWLEEHGQPDLGQFIRLQCLIDPLANDNPRRFELRQQEKKVWAALKKRWGPFFEVLGIKKHDFRRGFHDGWVDVDAVTFFDRYPEGWPWFPLQDLRLRKVAGTADRFARAGGLLSPVRYLGIWDRVEPEVLVALARHPRLPRLEWLNVDVSPVSRPLLAELAAAPWAGGLIALGLNHTGFVAGADRVQRGVFLLPFPRPKPTDRPTVREQLLTYRDRLPADPGE